MSDGLTAPCARCGLTKPRREFARAAKRPRGIQTYCRQCQREYDRARAEDARHRQRAQARKEANRAHLRSRKVGQPCALCGGHFPPEGLHFHHRDPATKVNGVCHMVDCSTAKLDAEIAKCVLLCGACHAREHHALRRGQSLLLEQSAA